MLQCTIVLAGELDGRFSHALDGMSLRAADGQTTLVGGLTDQAQLQGVLHQLFDLGLEVLSFTATPADHPGDRSPG